MTRDFGLEELVREQIADEPGLSEKRMFGGLAWLVHGNMLCAARVEGLLLRLGERGADALAIPGVEPMVQAGRPKPGWVRLQPPAVGDDALRQRLLGQALGLVRRLPPK